MEYVSCNDIPLGEIISKYSTIEGEIQERDGYKIKCPLHPDNSPSFKVYESTNTFHCFGCGKSGGPVDFVRMIKSLANNRDAEFFINQDFNINTDLPPDLSVFAKIKGLDESVLDSLGWYNVERGIAIPYKGVLAEQGTVTTKTRIKYSGANKYIKDGQGIMIPYGLEHIKPYDKRKPLYITEGETDMVTLYQAGYQALGVPGATAYTLDWNKYL